MIIRKVRLKNIKSFQEGDDGSGTVIHLQQGVNLITGRNGAGKSTLIEAIGMVLFDADPTHSWRQAQDTYLVRSGCSEGEIDVHFELDDQRFRVERGFGKGSRRIAKVVREEDDFLEAEGTEEVQAFLSQLMKISRKGGREAIFRKLLGVKQGMLNAPWEQSPAEARGYFESLLDVDVYRKSADLLRDPQSEVKRRLATMQERIRLKQEQREKLHTQVQGLLGLKERVWQLRKERGFLSKKQQEIQCELAKIHEKRRSLEKKKKHLLALEKELIRVKLEESQAEKDLFQCQKAKDFCKEHASVLKDYADAQEASKLLSRRQSELDSLKQEYKLREEGRKGFERELKTQTTLLEKRQKEEQSLCASKFQSERQQEQRVLDFKSLKEGVWTLHQEFGLQGRTDLLKEQKACLSEGKCPFVQRDCADCQDLGTEVFVDSVDVSLAELSGGEDLKRQLDVSKRLEEKMALLEQKELEVKRGDVFLQKQRTQLELKSQEIQSIQTALQKNTELLKDSQLSLDTLKQKINGFADLEEKWNCLQVDLQKLQKQVGVYEHNSSIAEGFNRQEKACVYLRKHVGFLEGAVSELTGELEQVDEASDANLEKHQGYLREWSQKKSALDMDLSWSAKEFRRIYQTSKELKVLESDLRELLEEEGRLLSVESLIGLGRKVLRKTAGAVAESLCVEVSGRAESMYRSLSGDLVSLDWSSKDYRLSMHSASGQRWFGMLSGGEKTKLSLAMLLSLERVISSTSFMALDEPSYGVDQQGREELVEAIDCLEREGICEQILVVSHDEGFDRDWHRVCLKKRMSQGTELEKGVQQELAALV